VKARLRVALVALAVVAVAGAALAQDAEPAGFSAPVLITSAGQSADGVVLNALLRRAGVDVRLENLAEVEQLEGVGVLVVTLGASQKALGAAGIDGTAEVARVDRLLVAAAERGIPVIGVHIGGEGRRGPLSQPYLDAVSDRVQLLLVTLEGNADGYFDAVAAENDIALDTFETVSALGSHLAGLIR
jgi:hypothetical protein